ncbi:MULTISPECIES: sialate O-acetylesterase [unclassified Lentimonas]|uniref:sialate O-acetylesterase n=1 Tax=unclassified Lentimonas TaxID=2630993 RepID=UPI001322C38B|nr:MULTISPECIES: sialate O-acetylesterase [unclassified Lentimonas]CAA6680235.1 Unannotated [Lentimonas sp. CC4]CAA6687386.1 Unannotated [Lentimonas sp. CC6]CAA7076747.1 Unannotated [Lentimonas sp. CC4]CAA7171848.1 Unannotated [Lentimonas sp. CC21]CAA7183583.1 Unannotated [Lentimonas sp. CC8]
MKITPKILLLLVALSLSVQAAHYRVYLLGGQSNGNGRGDAAELSTAPLSAYELAAPQTDVRFYWHKTQDTANGNLTQDTWLDLQVGSGHGVNNPSGNEVEFGCELSFGRDMADANPSANIAIIKYTHGGTNLRSDWSASGSNYATFVATVQTGLLALTEAGHTYELGGMLWLQGEHDTGGSAAGAYEGNLTNLIQRVRSDLGSSETSAFALPFIISGLSDSQYSNITTEGSGPYTVRLAQETVAATVRQAAFANSDGFSTYTGAVHFDAAGQIAIGKACAIQMLALEANDVDRDGLLTSEEASYETDPNNADSDNDGFEDGLEARLGSSPIDSSSFFKIYSAVNQSGDTYTLEWLAKPGETYSVERSYTLEPDSWVELASVTATNELGTWTGQPSVILPTGVIAFYGLEGEIGGNFDTASYDSPDSNTTTSASRLSQAGGLTGGGTNSRIINHSLFSPSISGNNGLNLGGCTETSRSAAITAGDTFSFSITATGDTTYEKLVFFANQFSTSAKIDITYRIGAGSEQDILIDYSPNPGNSNVSEVTVDFPDFNSNQEVTFTYYLYNSSAENYGVRFDDIALHATTTSGNDDDAAKLFFRIRHHSSN